MLAVAQNVENVELIKFVCISFILAGAVVYGAYKYYKAKKIQGIREDVYKLFVYVENRFKEEGSGKRKMQYVVTAAYQLLPRFLQTFVTKEMLQAIIQTWFDGVKDLLDDGKINASTSR